MITLYYKKLWKKYDEPHFRGDNSCRKIVLIFGVHQMHRRLSVRTVQHVKKNNNPDLREQRLEIAKKPMTGEHLTCQHLMNLTIIFTRFKVRSALS